MGWGSKRPLFYQIKEARLLYFKGGIGLLFFLFWNLRVKIEVQNLQKQKNIYLDNNINKRCYIDQDNFLSKNTPLKVSRISWNVI